MTDGRFEVKHDIPIGSNHYGIIDNITGEKYDKTKYDSQKLCNVINSFVEENEQLKQRIKNRLHYYRELCNKFDKVDGFTYNIVERIVEDLEDILK